MESKRFENVSLGAGLQHFSTSHQPRSLPPQRWSTNEQGFTPSADLPGVRNVHEHALRAERLRRETEAAMKIQAVYRGHRVRKSLRWKLPSGQTLGASLRGGHSHKAEEVRESRDSSAGTLTPPAEEDELEKEVSTPIISPLHSQPRISGTTRPQITSSSSTAIPQLSPWQQTGGDEHSIINVFTRQHEKLRQTLDQLSDQKRAEIRRFGEEGRAKSETPKHSLSVPGSQPSLTHSHSYTYTFEQSSASQSASPRSSIYSEDSLRTPAKHKTTSNRGSPSPASSPHSQDTSPTTPPSRASSASSHMSTSHSTQSEQRSKQGADERVHVITPPGSPSFVESFASLSPRSVSSQSSEPRSLPPKSPPKGDASTQSANPPSSSVPPPGLPSTTAGLPPTVTASEAGGRLSPRSLELKLHSELNLLETVEDSVRQLSQVESARAVSLAQQETVALAQLLKSRQHDHRQELQAMESKNKKEVEEAREKLDKEAALMAEQRQHIEREHAEQMQRIREEASRASQEATLRLNEARTTTCEAVIQAAKDHLEAAHKIATSAASAAAREAVKATLSSGTQKDQHNGMMSTNYESDFEAVSLTVSEADKVSTTQSKLTSVSVRSQSSGSSTTSIEEEIEQAGGDEDQEDEERGSVTPVMVSHEEEEEAMVIGRGDETLVDGLDESYQSQSAIEEVEEDISEVEVCIHYANRGFI